ncbi:DoxX family membrane protein [Gordonia sp. PKS22-38]|uniref:DoxX family membrane protein n=1 Tax=Gordonia prachuapensis TaxID=3115651 RepID=A0ABU7MZZ2_9ACTN|nr:DoxX family membrane protein [Gordonia sp. PKS22-38]
MLIRRIARPMLATAFVASGIDALRSPKAKAETARGFVDKSVEALPDDVTTKVPTDPETLVRINGAVQVGGGILLATGKFPRIAALALAGSTVPTTIAGHAFWEETDPERRAQQKVQFFKNVSLVGGLLIAAVDTEGKPSLAWRGRRKAADASHAIAAAIPIGAATSGSTWEALAERSQEGAHAIGERSAEAAEVIKNRAPEIADAAREYSSEAAEVIKHRAPEIAEAARGYSTEAADYVRHRAPELAQAAQKRSADFAEAAQKRSADFADAAQKQSDKAGKASKAAQKRTDKAAKVAQKQTKTAQKQAKVAQKRAEELAAEAQKRSSKAADRIKDRAPELADAARERSTDAAERFKNRAPDLVDDVNALADTARTKAAESAEEGRRRWREVRS